MDLRTNCHPEANGRQPRAGDLLWTIHLPLENGEKLSVGMGKKGRDIIFGMLIADCSDAGEAEPETVSEVQRLTTALHAAKAHPDYSYIVVPAKSEFTPNAAVFGAGQGGWERNTETPATKYDETWRRKREAT